MFLHEIDEFLGGVAEGPAVAHESLRDEHVVRTEAPPGLPVVVLQALVGPGLRAAALEDVFLAEVRLHAEEVRHIGDQAVEAGVDDRLERGDRLLDVGVVVVLGAVPEGGLGIEGQGGAGCGAAADLGLLALGGHGGKRLGGIVEVLEDPVDHLLGIAVRREHVLSRVDVVGEGRVVPDAHGLEEVEGAEELGFRLDPVDLGVVGIRNLVDDQVALVDAHIEGLIEAVSPPRAVEQPVAGLAGQLVGVAVAVGVVGVGAAAAVHVVGNDLEEVLLLDFLGAAEVSVVGLRDQFVRIVGRGIRVECVEIVRALAGVLQFLFTGTEGDGEQAGRSKV